MTDEEIFQYIRDYLESAFEKNLQNDVNITHFLLLKQFELLRGIDEILVKIKDKLSNA